MSLVTKWSRLFNERLTVLVLLGLKYWSFLPKLQTFRLSENLIKVRPLDVLLCLRDTTHQHRVSLQGRRRFFGDGLLRLLSGSSRLSMLKWKPQARPHPWFAVSSMAVRAQDLVFLPPALPTCCGHGLLLYGLISWFFLDSTILLSCFQTTAWRSHSVLKWPSKDVLT